MAPTVPLSYREAAAIVTRIAASPHIDLHRLGDGLALQALGLWGKAPVAARNAWLMRHAAGTLADARAAIAVAARPRHA